MDDFLVSKSASGSLSAGWRGGPWDGGLETSEGLAFTRPKLPRVLQEHRNESRERCRGNEPERPQRRSKSEGEKDEFLSPRLIGIL